MYDARVPLGRADVARILERDPGVTCLEQHGQHPAPQLDGADGAENPNLAAFCLLLIGDIGFPERFTVEIMQLWRLVRGKQGPVTVHLDTFHEQIRYPVGRVHVMGSPAVVAGVLAQVEELFDVDVPRLEVGAYRALALAALVDSDGGIVRDLQKGYDALAKAVGAPDMRAKAADRRPVVAEPARIFGEKRIVLDALEDRLEVVADR